MRQVLVLDGEHRAALAVIRSLGRAGYEVHVASSVTSSLAGGSRYARSETVVPDLFAERQGYVDAVVMRVQKLAAGVVVPITDASLLTLLPFRRRLAPAMIPFPAVDAYRRLSDKAIVAASAPAAGIAVPSQMILRSPPSVRQFEDMVFPTVIKPSLSVIGDGPERRKMGVLHAADSHELQARLREIPLDAYPLLIQQRIVGPGVGIFLLEWNGELIASFAHRRIREKPPAGGVSVYRESIPADPALVARSRALLKTLGWEGVAMVEYKVDAATNVPYLMEVNCRFWGSLQLAVDAGVDFPRLLLAAAAGDRPRPVTDYRVGVRSRWWWGDVDHLLARLRRSAKELALPPGAPTRWREVLDFLTLWRPGDRSEVLRLEDPWPFVRETVNWFRGR